MKHLLITILVMSLRSYGQPVVGLPFQSRPDGDDQILIVSIINNASQSVISIEASLSTIDESSNIVSIDTPTVPLGTGFIVRDTLQEVIYVVTNDHIYDEFLKIRKRYSNAVLLAGHNRGLGRERRILSRASSDAGSDIAIFNVARSSSFTHETAEAVWTGVPLELFLEDSAIVSGTFTTAIGYPLGLGVNGDSNKPIARKGIIAQDVSKDRTFIIDGISSHGNSGSPVFAHQKGKVPFLVGMMAGFHGDTVTDTEGNAIYGIHSITKQPYKIPYNSGLASCISASKIKEMVLQLRVKK